MMIMLGKHIEGPWTAGEMNIATLDGFRVHRIPISAGGRAIAAVWCGSVGKEFLGSPAQGRAHAALIVAAPETAAAGSTMLAALETVLTNIDAPAYRASLLAIVNAAIAQAEIAGIKAGE